LKKLGLDRLEDLPGIGPSIADDLRRIGIAVPAQIGAREPEALYGRLVAVDGPTDRCVLYILRAAHHFVENEGVVADDSLLRWWSWKDEGKGS
jgi:hypothetical protein